MSHMCRGRNKVSPSRKPQGRLWGFSTATLRLLFQPLGWNSSCYLWHHHRRLSQPVVLHTHKYKGLLLEISPQSCLLRSGWKLTSPFKICWEAFLLFLLGYREAFTVLEVLYRWIDCSGEDFTNITYLSPSL